MPDSATVAPPPAPAAPAKPAPTIAVSAMPTSLPKEPPAPGSPRERTLKALGKYAGRGTEPAAPADKAPPEPTKPVEKNGEDVEPVKPDAEPVKGGESIKAEPVQTDDKGKKISPWKIVDQYKERTAKLEAELVEARSAIVPETERKAISERAEKAEARVKELEDHIRYVDYTKHPEFINEYQKPYEKAINNAMAELGELTVESPDGKVRNFNVDDLLKLAGKPLQEAREEVDAKYGAFANDIMGHRKEVKMALQRQQDALEKAKKEGGERERKMQETSKKTLEDVNRHITTTWTKATEEAQSHEKYGRFFKPAEGDQDGNQRLAKGVELTERALRENAFDPSLSGEERAARVKRLVAVRNRSAAFGRVAAMVSKAESRITELEAELAKYKESEPGLAGTQPESENGQPADPRSRVMGALRKYVK